MRRAVLMLLLACAGRAFATEPRGFVGQILENVACTADHSQSYALYVPRAYTPTRKWPVIFCFDPGGRGLEPVERLKEAAEKFGCVVVGSNNSRNGPWSANLAAMRAIAGDVEGHLSIDGNRVYAAGLSGGARVATQMALMGLATGVIGCSAGFPVTGEEIPRRISFRYFGTAGTTDFNHREMARLDADLDERKAVHRIVFFEGGHEWAPPELMIQAVEWHEIQAMRAGARAQDNALIQASWQSRLAAAEREAPGPSWVALTALVTDFNGLVDTTEVERKAKLLAESRETKAWLKARRARDRREDELMSAMNEQIADGSIRDIRSFASDLRAEAAAPGDTPERQMVRRVVAAGVGAARENTRGLFEQKAYREAASWLELSAALRPGQSRVWYDLACAYALDGETRRALTALQDAAKAGYSDAAQAEAEPAFEKLKREPAFQQAIAAMRANPAEPARPSRGRP